MNIQTDNWIEKHYLPTTLLAGGKNWTYKRLEFYHKFLSLSKQSTSKWWSLMAGGCTLRLQTNCFKWYSASKCRWFSWSGVSNDKWLRHKWCQIRVLLLPFYGKFLSNGVSEERKVKVHPALGPCLLLWICKRTINYEWTGGFLCTQPLLGLGNDY